MIDELESGADVRDVAERNEVSDEAEDEQQKTEQAGVAAGCVRFHGWRNDEAVRILNRRWVRMEGLECGEKKPIRPIRRQRTYLTRPRRPSLDWRVMLPARSLVHPDQAASIAALTGLAGPSEYSAGLAAPLSLQPLQHLRTKPAEVTGILTDADLPRASWKLKLSSAGYQKPGTAKLPARERV